MLLDVPSGHRPPIGSLKGSLIRGYLLYPVCLQFPLDPVHKLVTGECIELNTATVIAPLVIVPAAEEFDLCIDGAVLLQIPPRIPLAVGHVLAWEIVALDIREPDTEIDHLDVILECIAAGIPLQCAGNGKARLVEIPSHQ